MIQAPKRLEVKLDLKVFSIAGTWEPSNVERRAAWDLYVELVTRTSVHAAPGGYVRESLTSVYSIFNTARGILKQYGPAVANPKPSGEYNLGILIVSLLNGSLRPFLTRWHPRLEDWEARRASTVSRISHESAWTDLAAYQADLSKLNEGVRQYVDLLATACGVPDLLVH